TLREPLTCLGGIEREIARAYAEGTQPRERVVNRRLHLRMRRVAQVTEVGRKVGWSDEDDLDARGHGDRLERVEPGPALDLGDQAQLVGGAAQVATVESVAGGPADA